MLGSPGWGFLRSHFTLCAKCEVSGGRFWKQIKLGVNVFFFPFTFGIYMKHRRLLDSCLPVKCLLAGELDRRWILKGLCE